MISSKDPGSMPPPPGVRRISQSVAMADAIPMPDWQYRYYSFNWQWSDGEQMASMRDGSGDSCFMLFTGYGAIIKGYAHESVMAEHSVRTGVVWPGVIDHVPEVFTSFLVEPAFMIHETTFCIWWLNSENHWNIGPIQFPSSLDPDGSESHLSVLDDEPQTYQAWAENYYGVEVPLAAVQRLYRHEPLNEELAHAINPERKFADLLEDVADIGYPIA